eukprot:Tbor_TRINITY_DN5138_c0_g1::TRINITY_DN5138_c0_g1_i1::g.26040::m.26040
MQIEEINTLCSVYEPNTPLLSSRTPNPITSHSGSTLSNESALNISDKSSNTTTTTKPLVSEYTGARGEPSGLRESSAKESQYVSPRREVVSSGSHQAQILLDSARATITMLTEEVVSLRRENKRLQIQVDEAKESAHQNKKIKSQLAAARNEIDVITTQLNDALDENQKLEQISQQHKRRSEIAIKSEQRVKKEKVDYQQRSANLTREIDVIKVSTKYTIDQLTAALLAGNPALRNELLCSSSAV